MNPLPLQNRVEQILEEFRGISNEQAYYNVFEKRVMKPIPGRNDAFLGSDQRLDMLPSLEKLVRKLPRNGQVFDVGAGAGAVVDFALNKAPEDAVINIEEPNTLLIQEYKQRLEKHPHLRRGVAYAGPLQDYYQGSASALAPKAPQDLILAIHMIYHLTDFTQPQITPKEDIINAISFLYSLLKPNGSIFIVYADLLDHPQGGALCGLAEKYFRQKLPQQPYADHLVAIYKARNQLLGPGGSIAKHLLQRFPKTQPLLKSERHPCHFFGESQADIAVMAMATELCPSDTKPFDISKLKFCLDYVLHHPEQIGLEVETGNIPQKGLWRANEPQVISIITKNA